MKDVLKEIKVENEISIRDTEYIVIDVLKFCFACLIPLLHINFGENRILIIMQQYVARLGVPFFFATTGFLLAREIERSGSIKSSCKKFGKRLGWLLLLWLMIDLPFYFITNHREFELTIYWLIGFVQKLIFLTPCYLWYLSSALVGIFIVFVCMRYLKKLQTVCILSIIYVVGVFGNSWDGILGVALPQQYFDIFLTTRNGVFFTPLHIYIGICVWRNKANSKMIYPFIASLVLYIAEVFYVRQRVAVGTDTSMYFTLPVLIYTLLSLVKQVKTKIKIEKKTMLILRKFSVLFYCTQYLCLTLVQWLQERLQYSDMIKVALSYACILSCSAIIMIIVKRTESRVLKKMC